MDMHVHSCFSVEPIPGVASVGFSPLETPDEIYARAKARGMDFVTITDHDTIAGCTEFLSRHPDVTDLVVGEEVSTQLPASGLTVHINVYGHDERQHAELQRLRPDAFQVARYCVEQGLFFAWNHPFYRENLSTIEEAEFMRLVAEVPVLEVRNGGRTQLLNVLAEELAVRTGKPCQGGSDTHTGDVGAVYTAVECEDLAGFFAGILRRESRIVGRHSTRRNFLVHNLLVGTRRTIASELARSHSRLASARLLALGLLAIALSPVIVMHHFRGQARLGALAIEHISLFSHLPPTLLDAA